MLLCNQTDENKIQIQIQLRASAPVWNCISKCHRISWDGHDVGSTVGDSLLSHSVSSVFVFSIQDVHLYWLI
jgi:hypothetical protein